MSSRIEQRLDHRRGGHGGGVVVETMDVPRSRRVPPARLLPVGIVALGVIASAVALSRTDRSVPIVERDRLVVDTVQRGDMVRTVRGTGTLVSERIRWIAARTAGRVERILIRPGDVVEEGTVVLELSNPDVEIEALEAMQALSEQESHLADLQASSGSAALSQESVLASLRAPHREAVRLLATNEELSAAGLIARQDLETSRERARELQERLDIETRRLEAMRVSAEGQLEAQRAQVDGLRAIAAFKRRRVESMTVRSGVTGVLAELPLEEGQWVRPGDDIARIVDPDRLIARLHVPETMARDVRVGHPVSVSIRTQGMAGRVARIDPVAKEGTVSVDVALTEPLPDEVRPDLNVDGTIEVEKLHDVLRVRRPSYGRPSSTIRLFRISDGLATQVPVRIGRASVDEVEIVEGLSRGDRVIVSDMSAWSDHERIRIR